LIAAVDELNVFSVFDRAHKLRVDARGAGIWVVYIVETRAEQAESESEAREEDDDREQNRGGAIAMICPEV
jgi:hypothetical protein